VAASFSLDLVILSSLLDDIESLESMRNTGEDPPYGLALVDEHRVADEVRRLLKAGLVEALVPNTLRNRYEVVDLKERSPTDLNDCWFRPTFRGWQRLWNHHDAVLEYRDSERP
jgi:hypothetical protein